MKSTVFLVWLAALLTGCGPRAPFERAASVPGGPGAPGALDREALDLGVACLAAGHMDPPVETLADGELAELVELVARLRAAYERADFDSFLALRWRDLEHANGAREDRVRELRALCRQLRVPRFALDGDWTELLGAYWHAYYRAPPVARFRPEETRAVLQVVEVPGAELAVWEAGFERLHEERPGAAIEHTLVVPHRRTLAAVAADPGPLRWLDLELGFEAHDGTAGRLIARFVWDGPTEEWFLHRATTLSDGERGDDARFLVL
jgi:hypothetical protein